MPPNKLNVLSLFAGIGAFDYGLEKTGGFETKAFCEIDSNCQLVLRKHWPNVPIFDDVRKLSKENIADKIDVICGGFPCQDISVAGNKKGFTDEEGNTTRSGLWFEYRRLIEEIRPKYVLIENVANLRNKGLGTIIKDLWEIGYVGEWNIISARSVGACHLRERIWIIAYPLCIGLNERKRFEDEIQQPKLKRIQRKEIEQSILPESLYSSDENVTDPYGISLREQSRGSSGKNWTDSRDSRIHGETRESSNADDFRLWRSFATEEEKFQWWTEATASVRDVFGKISEIEPCVRICNDGTSSQLERNTRRSWLETRIRDVNRKLERIRKERVKQLGNALVPQIPQIIGQAILDYEQMHGL